MTGYQSKRAAARDKLNDDDDTQVYGDALTIAYQSGYYDGKKAAQPAQETVGFVDSKLNPIQRPWQEPTESEWFEWWRVSQVADETEIDFADFMTIAQAVAAKLKERNA